jgi:hypothetical protein
LIGVLSFKVLIIDQGKNSVAWTYIFYFFFFNTHIFKSHLYVVAIDY